MSSDEYAEWLAYWYIEIHPMLTAELRPLPKVQSPARMMDVAKLVSGWFKRG